MIGRWLKGYMPRGLYGRAALILLLPFVTLQVIVFVVFIQRHFEDVTRQMTTTQAVKIDYILRELPAHGVGATAVQVAEPLRIMLSVVDQAPAQDRKLWYDVSGITVIAQLRALYDIAAIDLATNRRVILWLRTDQGLLRLNFERRTVSARNPHQLLVLVVFTGVLLILVSFVFLRNQLRPIRRLARAAQAFGRGRQVAYSPSGALEVRAAGNAFLDMRGRIERHIEQRTLLLSGVSHDLRTPLTRLRLGLSMLPQDAEVEALRGDVEDMTAMTDAFLDFASDGADSTPELTDLRDLVQGAVQNSEDGVTLTLPDEPVMVAVRPTAIKRALANLVGNAQRYGDQIRVSLRPLNKSVTIRVEDNGPGIAPDQRANALRPFTRLEPARSQNTGGSVGLGLAIAADIARQHGGALTLTESADLGGLQADIVLSL